MVVLIEGVRYRLINPESEAALEQIIRDNHQHIFGPESFYFDVKRTIKSKAGVGSIPDGYVIILDPIPKWCILEVELSSHPVYDHLIPQLTKFNRGIDDSSTRKKLVDILYAAINEDEVLKARLKLKIGSGEIYKFLSDLISDDPLIVVAIDERTEELEEALKDIRGEVKSLEFKIFQREGVSDPINAYVFNPIVKEKRTKRVGMSPPSARAKPARRRKTILPAGLKLHNVYLGNEFFAEVVEGGRIEFNGQVYNSVSGAAVAAIRSTGSSRRTEDGWRWWRFRDPQTGEDRLIDTLRRE